MSGWLLITLFFAGKAWLDYRRYRRDKAFAESERKRYAALEAAEYDEWLHSKDSFVRAWKDDQIEAELAAELA